MEKAKTLRAKHNLDEEQVEDMDEMLFRQMRSKEREYKPIKFWDEGSSTIPLKKTAASSKAIKNL